jgi:hypothetical protein
VKQHWFESITTFFAFLADTCPSSCRVPVLATESRDACCICSGY